MTFSPKKSAKNSRIYTRKKFQFFLSKDKSIEHKWLIDYKYIFKYVFSISFELWMEEKTGWKCWEKTSVSLALLCFALSLS